MDSSPAAGPASGPPSTAWGVDRFGSFYRQQVAAIYRFHLIRSGDPAEAEARTALTFRTAWQWIENDRPKPEDLLPWLGRVACRARPAFSRVFARRQPTPDREAPVDLSSSAAEQAQLQRLLAAQAAELVNRLPARQAEAIALNLFAGLDSTATGKVLGEKPSEAADLICRGLSSLDRIAYESGGASLDLPAERGDARPIPCTGTDGPGFEASSPVGASLRTLAARIQPDSGFVETLGAELALAPARPTRRRWSGWNWNAEYRLRRALVGSAWTLAAGAVIILLGLNFIGLPDRSLPPTPQPVATASPIPAGEPGTGGSGYLIPPDPAACQEWQEALGAVLKLRVDLIGRAFFTDPNLFDRDRNGTGCELTVEDTGVAFQGINETLDRVSPLLVAKGYHVDGQYEVTSACPQCFQFRRDWFGRGLVFNKDDSRAILSVSWRPYDLRVCPTAGPEEDCKLPRGLKFYTLRLALAADPVRHTLKTFLNRWQSGDPRALDFLGADFRSRIPDLAALDRLAGLDRSQFQQAEITWQTREALRSRARLEVAVHQMRDATHLPKDFGTLGIILAAVDGKWQVQDVWSTAFQLTQDAAFLASSDGEIFELSVDDHAVIPLSGSGFFRPLTRASSLPLGTQAHLSPNGEWLALALPDNPPPQPSNGGKEYRGTWVLSTGGSGPRQLDPRPLRLIWSPNSRMIAFISPDDPQSIFLQQISGGSASVLSRLPGVIRSMAWSPSEDRIGVSYAVPPRSGPGGTASTDRVGVALVDIGTGKADEMASFPLRFDPRSRNPDFDLDWTSDGRELWYDPETSAIDTLTGEVRPLLAQPGSSDLHNQQQHLLHWNTGTNPGEMINEVSADGKQIARAFAESYLGSAYRVAIESYRPFANEPITQEIGPIAAMAWTEDGESLFVAGGMQGSGPLWVMNPHTGQTKVLASSVFYIGLRSKMQRESLHLAPETQIRPLPEPPSPDQWAVSDESASRIRFHYPPGWKLTGPEPGFGWTSLSSVDFSSPFGFHSLGQDDMLVMISEQPVLRGQNRAGLQEQVASDNQQKPTWETVEIAGRVGYRTIRQVTPGDPQIVEIPLEESTLYILKYPYQSNLDPVFEQVLQGLEVK